MLLYDKRAGAIAYAYAIARSSELPHFDKNAKYIEEWFRKMLQAGFEGHKLICETNLERFGVHFAKLAFGRTNAQAVELCEDIFFHMCYLFVLYEAYTNGFKVDMALCKRSSAFASRLGLQEQEMLWFFKKIIDDAWLLHTHKSQQEERSLLSA